MQESLENIVTPKLETKLITWHPGLLHHQFGRSNLEMVANMYSFFQKPCDCEVLTEHPPGQFHLRKLLSPERVMVRWISIDGLLQSTMDSEICLAIPFKIQAPHSDPTFHCLFKNSSLHRLAFPDHFSRHPNIDRYYLHQRCWLHAFSPQFALSHN